MSMVYLALDLEESSTVAVKVLPRTLDTKPVRDRFLREANILESIEHPNVVTLRDAGVFDGGQPFLVMDLVQGQSLFTRLRSRGALALELTAEIGIQLLAAIEAAERAGVLHRDLKTSNVLIASEHPFRVVLIDFGVGQLLHGMDRGGSPAHEEGLLVGTPCYLAPELLTGQEVSLLSELYTLGSVLWECLTGRYLVAPNEDLVELFDTIRALVPDAPSRHRADHDSRLDAVVLRCLEREPSKRYGSCGELRDALRGVPLAG